MAFTPEEALLGSLEACSSPISPRIVCLRTAVHSVMAYIPGGW